MVSTQLRLFHQAKVMHWVTSLILFFCGACALNAQELNRVETYVQSQGQQELNQAISKGLSEVIVRISGNQSVLENSQIQQALNQPQRYMQGYSYETLSEEVALADGSWSHLQLNLTFSTAAVEKLLKGLKLPVWSASRPSLLVWTAIQQDGANRVLISEESEVNLQALVKRQSSRRGVTSILPVMDLEDTVNISPDDIWSLSKDKVLQASTRYGAQHILAGRVYSVAPKQWIGQWLLISKGEVQQVSVSGASAIEVLANAIDPMVDQMSAFYAITTGAEQQPTGVGQVWMKVEGVSQAQSYALLVNYLEGLAPIQSLQVVEVSRESLWLLLELRGSVRQVADAIALDIKLEPTQEIQQDANGTVQYFYRWRN